MSTASRDIEGLSPLQRAVLALKEMRAKLDAVERGRREPVAIVGLGCRFPGGADDPDSFWRLLHHGRSGIVEVPRDRWDVDAYYDPQPATPGKMYTRHGGFLSRVDGFDPGFFGVSAREAASMDPQQRLLLEVSWEALEYAGESPRRLSGSSTGVFFGVASNDYAQSIMRRTELRDIDLYFASGTPFNTFAGRVSYILGLQGPTLALDTACSSSLVALHLACQSLRNGECDMALAGGVNLMLAPETTVIICQNRMLAADGRCKTFDAAADGYVRGEGCGVLVLKRLSDAMTDGNEVHAVIPGSFVNHDGRSSGFTVPNGQAQQALILRALQIAGVEPSAVSYVEAHGTGTSLGDPIEIGALGAVFGGPRAEPLLVGSVKTNIGHLEAAAGIAGLIKIVLALEHEEIPPHLNLERPSPHIAWGDLSLRVPTEPVPWRRGGRLRVAAVSSFGVSGTNAHIVVSEAPAREVGPALPERPSHLMIVSARTEPALKELATRYARHLESHPSLSLANAGFTAARGRSHFAQRLAVVGRTGAEAAEKLHAFARGERSAGLARGSVEPGRRIEVVFLFTGQGSQYAGMGRDLYGTSPVFREALDRCAELLRPHIDRPLLSVLHPVDGERSPLDETQYTQPALFALEYALAALWRSWGVEPSVVLGHSVGEYVAACVAGVFSLEDGLKLIAARGRLMQALPRDGEMVAVFAGEERVAAAVGRRAAHVSIAAFNDPRNVVISGRSDSVRETVAELESEGIRSKRLTVSHAFHSPLMDPILDEFEREAGGVTFAAPHIPLVSNVSGEIAGGALVSSAGYWRRHVREPVRFMESMRTLEAQGHRLFLEVGPGTTLLAMGRKCAGVDDGAWLPSLREGRDDWSEMLESLGRLHAHGVEIDWAGFDRPYSRRRVALPTYPFERHRCWVDTDPSAEPRGAGAGPAPSGIVRLLDAGDAQRLALELGAAGAFSEPERRLLPRMVEVLVRKHLGSSDDDGIQEWMHEVEWREAPGPESPIGGRDGGAWLVLADAGGVGRALARRLRDRGDPCVLVEPAAAFERNDSSVKIDPARAADYDRMLEGASAAAGGRMRGVIHMWALSSGDSSSLTAESLAAAQTAGSGSALLLLQALMRSTVEPRPRLWLTTRGSTPADGDAVKGMAHTPLWGLGRVIAIECPDAWGGLIDLESTPRSEGDEAAAVMAEILGPGGEDQVALRGARRFVPRVIHSRREATRSLRLEAEATYLITGGLGGLGGKVAGWMAERGARHLVLVGRRGAAVHAALETIERLRRSGVEVRVVKADVADAEAMSATIEEIRSAMPALRGIVHAAGVIDDGILMQQSRERFDGVLAPKVLGAWNLHRLTRETPLDHFVMFSSTASLLGEGGQGNYSAANAFLDALAYHRRALGLPATTINWGPWAEVGIATERVLERVLRRGIGAISPERGVRALEAALGRQVSQIAVVAADWKKFFERVPASAGAPLLRELARGHAAAESDGRVTRRKGAPRPGLQVDFVSPGNETERKLAEIWAEELGIDQVGVNDNLFELGGDSLISIQIVNRVRKEWRKEISTVALYEAPTVGSLAKMIAGEPAGGLGLDESDMRAQRRRSRVAARKP